MKKLEWGKYALIYLAGFLTSFSGALGKVRISGEILLG